MKKKKKSTNKDNNNKTKEKTPLLSRSISEFKAHSVGGVSETYGKKYVTETDFVSLNRS